MTKDFADKLVTELGRRIDYHRNNQNDPHGIGNAVIAALTEVALAVKTVQLTEDIGGGILHRNDVGDTASDLMARHPKPK